MSRESDPSVRRALVAITVSWFAATACFGIDNPDAPDLMAQFLGRATVYEARIGAAAGTVNDTVAAYASYQSFLDAELNRVYGALAKKLSPESRLKLIQSQGRWLVFRDAEIRFIDNNWTQAQVGTSAVLSRGAYRSSLVKERIATLIQYLKSYP